MATHEPQIMRTPAGAKEPGVFGVCSCRQRQSKPVPTRQEAEDWVRHHLDQVRLAQADPGKQLSPALYLEYLKEKAADMDLPAAQRAQWQVLADEQERRVRQRTQPRMKGIPASPNTKYDTGVETEPLF